jgi:hypothetical protein
MNADPLLEKLVWVLASTWMQSCEGGLQASLQHKETGMVALGRS